MAEPIIQLKHLTKRFGGGENEVRALEDVSIEVRAGEIFGVIGLSGAGKSTLVRCINLLERPTAGEVIVDGRDMLRLTEKELRRARQSIGMIFQSFNLLMQPPGPPGWGSSASAWSQKAPYSSKYAPFSFSRSCSRPLVSRIRTAPGRMARALAISWVDSSWK